MFGAKQSVFLTRVAFAPIFLYFLWVSLASEKWKERASFPAPEIAGIPSMLCRAVSFVSTLLPHFGYFILTASFCLLGIPTLALLFLRFGQNNVEVLYIFRACKRVLGSRLSVVTVNVSSVLSLLDTLTSWCQKQLLFLVAKPNSLGSHKYLYEHKLRVLNEGAFRTWTVSAFRTSELARQVRKFMLNFFKFKSQALALSPVLGTCFELFLGARLLDRHKVPDLASFQTVNFLKESMVTNIASH